MNILELIEKKKNKLMLSEEEWIFFVNEFTNGNIPDYQAAALLMAIRINGCNDEETYWLTKAMVNSGDTMHPVATNDLHILIDKHSSGGVGDKVSLILSPILVALGYDVAKLSGRGLSFTGGTIDKLESVGVDASYDPIHYQQQLNESHMFLMIQGSQIVPADKKIYALRDVTGTVDSWPLIASSIMSKKLAITGDYIFLDLKVGSGAFCKTIDEAKLLAEKMLYIADRFNRKLVIELTNMSTPLGRCIGNRIEIKEALEFLQNNSNSDNLHDLIYQLVSNIMVETKVVGSIQTAVYKIDEVLHSLKAYHAFMNYLKNQGVDTTQIQNNQYWHPKFQYEIKANNFGYIHYLRADEIGLVSVELGAGRKKKDDPIDFDAGIYLNKENNEYTVLGETIATLYSDSPIPEVAIQRFLNNVEYKKQPSKPSKNILMTLKN